MYGLPHYHRGIYVSATFYALCCVRNILSTLVLIVCLQYLNVFYRDGAISAKKCLKGDGPIECDSDEAVSDGAIAYALKKRVRVTSGTAIGRKVKPRVQKKIITTSSQKSSIIAGVASDDSFVAVQLDAKGNARRIYLDNGKETDEEAMRPKKQNKVSFC